MNARHILCEPSLRGRSLSERFVSEPCCLSMQLIHLWSLTLGRYGATTLLSSFTCTGLCPAVSPLEGCVAVAFLDPRCVLID